jgi:hypothetical protein
MNLDRFVANRFQPSPARLGWSYSPEGFSNECCYLDALHRIRDEDDPG